jgi:hypothetical protein
MADIERRFDDRIERVLSLLNRGLLIAVAHDEEIMTTCV